MSLPVEISYNDLVEGKPELLAQVAEAFGEHPNCLGIIFVKDIPNYSEKRKRLLPLAAKVANLSPEAIKKIESEKSAYQVGWSHGKEKFQGKFDTAKGSFYANPQYDEPTTDQALIDKYPTYLTPNIWPEEEIPDLHPALLDLGKLIVNVGIMVGKLCDQYVSSKVSGYPSNYMERVISTTNSSKSRLLHYFPQSSGTPDEEGNKKDMDSWCGWHFDHGALTGLTSALYLDKDLNPVPCPDPTSGLYIKNRGGEIVKAVIPPESLAFQMGEVSQIASGGLLRATSHCVRAAYGPQMDHISRNTFAVFMQPMYDEKMHIPEGFDYTTSDVKGFISPEQTFYDFSEEKFKEYY